MVVFIPNPKFGPISRKISYNIVADMQKKGNWYFKGGFFKHLFRKLSNKKRRR